jgi:arylformamidase
VADRRVQFDFEIEFSNGGGLRGQGFRLDIEGDDIADEALADYLVRDMRLLMVGTVRIHNKTILAEAHKRPTWPAAPRRLVDVSHDVEDGMVTYRGLPRRSSVTTGPARSPAATLPPARSSTSAGSRWSRTRVRTWTVRFTATRAAAIWRACRSSPWPTSRASWFAWRARRAAGSTWRPSPGWTVRGKAVLLHTGRDAHWRTERYFEGHPFLTAAGAE